MSYTGGGTDLVTGGGTDQVTGGGTADLRLLLASRSFNPPWGGLDQFVARLASWMQLDGADVTVVTGSPGDPAADAARPYRVVRRPTPRRLTDLLRRSDVIHVQGPSLRTIGTTRLLGRPLVVTHHDFAGVCPMRQAWARAGPCPARGSRPGPCAVCPGRGWRGRAVVQGQRASFRAAAANVCVSAFLAEFLSLARTQVVPNPLPAEFFADRAPGPGADGVIAFVGRLVPEKGADVLVRAVADLPGTTLRIAGQGADAGRLRHLAEDLGISERVQLLGPQEQAAVRELLAAASVVCVPSVWDEPLGYSAAEAMAMERPVVATPSGGLVGLLDDRRGYLAAGRSPAALAETLEAALSDPAERAERARRGHDHVAAEMTAERAGRRYLSVYASARDA